MRVDYQLEAALPDQLQHAFEHQHLPVGFPCAPSIPNSPFMFRLAQSGTSSSRLLQPTTCLSSKFTPLATPAAVGPFDPALVGLASPSTLSQFHPPPTVVTTGLQPPDTQSVQPTSLRTAQLEAGRRRLDLSTCRHQPDWYQPRVGQDGNASGRFGRVDWRTATPRGPITVGPLASNIQDRPLASVSPSSLTSALFAGTSAPHSVVPSTPNSLVCPLLPPNTPSHQHHRYHFSLSPQLPSQPAPSNEARLHRHMSTSVSTALRGARQTESPGGNGRVETVSTGSGQRVSGKQTRMRTVLSERQLAALRACYAVNPRPDGLTKEQLAIVTGLSSRVIRVWFQNKRCKDKKRQTSLSTGGHEAEVKQTIGKEQLDRPNGLMMQASLEAGKRDRKVAPNGLTIRERGADDTREEGKRAKDRTKEKEEQEYEEEKEEEEEEEEDEDEDDDEEEEEEEDEDEGDEGDEVDEEDEEETEQDEPNEGEAEEIKGGAGRVRVLQQGMRDTDQPLAASGHAPLRGRLLCLDEIVMDQIAPVEEQKVEHQVSSLHSFLT
ncbi:unnamed protein product [Protopolystoma xenopodis]|uniref:Homeobox domain-containing protein n=1 Tax=Protopolystoma xenopodis TaxID=117903 RepID=A0A448WQW6_9PLAT|nr:unnamed protein product [Protopolystoma xenopodis]